MSEPNGNGQGLSVKEWLVRLDTKLDNVSLQLSTKAERQEVEEIRKRVEKLELWKAAVVGLGIGFFFNFSVNLLQLFRVLHQ